MNVKGSNSARTSSDANQVEPAERPRASAPVLVLAVLAVLAVLYVAQDVAIPIVFAALLALLLRPALVRLRAAGLPDLVSAFLLVAALAVFFSIGVVFLAGQAQTWLAQAPETVRKVSSMLPTQWGPLDDLTATQEAVSEMATTENADKPMTVVVKSELPMTILGVSGHFLAATLIVFVLCFFILGFSDTLLRQATRARETFGQKRNLVETVLNVERGISTYLWTICAINAGLGCVTALAMWLLNLPNPILWGVMAAALNLVPHVGAFVCMVVLFFVGSVSHESILYGGATAGVFMLLTSIESYFMTPIILSRSLQLSPLAVILAILLMGWMWGIAGALMAAPLLAIAKIICDNFPSLQPWADLLSGEARTKPQAELVPSEATN